MDMLNLLHRQLIHREVKLSLGQRTEELFLQVLLSQLIVVLELANLSYRDIKKQVHIENKFLGK